MTEITHVKDLTERNIKEILGILLLGGFFTMLNETALNIAFPSIMIEYAVSASTVQWLTTIFVFISGIVFSKCIFNEKIFDKKPVCRSFGISSNRNYNWVSLK